MAGYYPRGTVYLNFHFLLDENGEGNFGPEGDNNPNNPPGNSTYHTGQQIVDLIMADLESFITNIETPVEEGQNGAVPSPQRLPWKFELYTDPENEEDEYGGIWFWNDADYEDWYNVSNSLNIDAASIREYSQYGSDAQGNKVIDVYMVETSPSVNSPHGWAPEANNPGAGIFLFGAWSSWITWENSTTNDIGFWNLAKTLNHELGHIFGLSHTDETAQCSEIVVSHELAPDPVSNNVMHGDVHCCAFTPCQVEIMYAHFLTASDRPYFHPIDPCVYHPDPLVIDEPDAVFNSQITLDRDIIIEPNAKLTIECELRLPADGKIKIKPQGRLVLDEATVTAGCDGELWYGIEVYGNRPGQNGHVQSTLESENSTISLAQVAVSNPNYSTFNGNANFSGGGGIMDLVNTHFVNNTSSIWLYPYIHSTSLFSLRYPLKSHDCTFITNPDYPATAPNPVQVIAFGVNGPDLKNALFENQRKNVTSLEKLGIGIVSVGGGLAMTGPVYENRSKVEGYQYGIVTFGNSNSFSYSLLNIDFIENVVGVASQGVDMFRIENCLFEVGGLDLPLNVNGNDIHEGLSVLTGSAFTITKNNFIGPDNGPDDVPPGTFHDPDKWGLRVLNTGTVSNLIENNYFENLYIANRAEGLHRDPFDAFTGLSYECNENINFRYDFDVHPINSEDGINQNQGSEDKPADNYFTQLQSSYPSDFYNGADWIVQYWFSDNDAKFEPLDYFSFTNFVPRKITDYEGTCGQIGNSEPSDDDIGDLVDLYWSSNDIQDSLQTIRESLIDDGNTTSWLSDLALSNSSTKGAFLGDLTTLSPYTSETLLTAIIDRTSLFDSTEIHNILVSNPHFYFDPALRESLELDWGFEEDTLTSIFRHNSSSLLELDANISFATAEKGAVRNRILDYYHTDSLDHEAIEYWLTIDPNHEYAYMEANLAAQAGNYIKASALVNSLSSDYDLTPKLENDQDFYLEWLDLAETLNSQPDSVWHNLQDSTRKAFLNEVASAEPCRAAAYARGMIYLVDRDSIPYWPPIPIDSSIVPRSADENLGLMKGNLAAYHEISIKPHPVRNEFTFLYDVPKHEKDVLTIFTIAGEKIWQQPLQRGDQHQLIVSELSPGLYMGIISNTGNSSRYIFRFVKL